MLNFTFYAAYIVANRDHNYTWIKTLDGQKDHYGLSISSKRVSSDRGIIQHRNTNNF